MATTSRLFGTDRHKKTQRRAVDYQEVARVAYALYERRGRIDGHDVEDWLEAEQQVRQRERLASRFVAYA